MPLTDERIEEIAAACHEAYIATATRPVLHWDDLGDGSKGHWRRVAQAVASAALLPLGTVAMERGRAERLEQIEAAAREYAESRRAWVEASRADSIDASYVAIQDRQDAAWANLLAVFAESLPEGPCDDD